MEQNTNLKLFMLLLGSRPSGRHVEQHDFFFGIAHRLKELIPAIKAFWPEAKDKIHIDGWREVTNIDGYQVKIIGREESLISASSKKLFFINLGGYQENKFEEQHYTILTVKDNRAQAFDEAKSTLFFKHNHFKNAHSKEANSHIDDKYGIDVDDLYQIEEILSPEQKKLYQIELIPGSNLPEDQLHLGYFKLNSL
jgi:hypothetical protein